ncbi:MAG: hypothetical protein LBR06_09580 [Bacteroidales bacterium]|jgi:hypothetical protein|nr:hypothetical protein [Bacteroidales bacterium]
MQKIYFLRTVVAVATCLAVSTMFSGCSKDDDPNGGETGIPGAVQNLTATAGDGQVSLVWAAPDSGGGLTVKLFNRLSGCLNRDSAMIHEISMIMPKNQEIAGQARNDGVLKNHGNHKNLTKIQVQTKGIAGQARNDGASGQSQNHTQISGSDKKFINPQIFTK